METFQTRATVMLAISLILFTNKSSFVTMAKQQVQKNPVTFKEAYHKFEKTVEEEVTKALRMSTHAFFKVKRIKSHPMHRKLVQSALNKYVDEDFHFILDETETDFEITIVQTPKAHAPTPEPTPVPVEEEEEKKGWISWGSS